MDYAYRIVNEASEPGSTTVTSTGASYPSGIGLVTTTQYDVGDTYSTTWNSSTGAATYASTPVSGCSDPGDSSDRSDSYDNVVSTLSATNRASAYAAASDSWGSSSASAAGPLESTSSYNEDGMALTATEGPAHMVQLSSSSPGTLTQAQQVTNYTYDTGAPNNDYNTATEQPYGLVTQVQTGAQPTAGGSETDERTTTNGYNALSGYSGLSQTISGIGIGWVLGEPTTVSVTPSTGTTLTR
jgi:hypothetical protein